MGEILAIITVLQLPPNESFNNLVNLLSRYGMWVYLTPFSTYSHNALITFPNASNDRFMLAPSIMRMPLLLVLAALYEPARSINDNLPILTSLI